MLLPFPISLFFSLQRPGVRSDVQRRGPWPVECDRHSAGRRVGKVGGIGNDLFNGAGIDVGGFIGNELGGFANVVGVGPGPGVGVGVGLGVGFEAGKSPGITAALGALAIALTSD